MNFDFEKYKLLAIDSGFQLFGITNAEIPIDDKNNFDKWIVLKLFGKMIWFEKNQAIRKNFSNLGFSPNSAILLGSIYVCEEYEKIKSKYSFRISRYSIGDDYHTVLKSKAKPIIKELKESYPTYHFRNSVDSLPISEKVLGRESGIGWIGKNTNLINEHIGSYFFISVILTDLNIPVAKKIATDRCGTCTACLDACPTNALFEPYKIDAGKCISHHTIEDRSESFSEDIKNSLVNWVYGCDICQEVCPWDKVKQEKKNLFTSLEEFSPRPIFELNENEFRNMNEDEFNEWVKFSPVNRISFKQFKRNLEANL